MVIIVIIIVVIIIIVMMIITIIIIMMMMIMFKEKAQLSVLVFNRALISIDFHLRFVQAVN